MREPKKMKSSPTVVATAATDSINGISSPHNHPPRTPKQGDSVGTPDTPGARAELQWQPQSQTPTNQPRTIKQESLTDMPPPTPEITGAATPLSQRSPAQANIPGSPLDQFRKEDPMEKLTQMTSSIGQTATAGSSLSIRSPSGAPSTPGSNYTAQSPGAGTSGGNGGNIRGLTHLSAMSPHLVSGSMVTPGGSGSAAGSVGTPYHGMPSADQPYLPCQNCIFVFDTELANLAADAVSRNMCPSIVDYHIGTDKVQASLARSPDIRAAVSGSQQMRQMQQRTFGQMMPHMGMIRHPARLNQHHNNIRAEFCGGNVHTPPAQSLTKQMKMNNLRMMQEMFVSGTNNGQPSPPPYGSSVAPLASITTSRPPRPAGSTSSRNHKRPTRIDSAPGSSQEVNFPGQQQDMDALIKSDPNTTCKFPGNDVAGGVYCGSAPQTLSQSKGKEGSTNVMPVPSPQPIQYISSQLDQEVVIQKQPNRNFVRVGLPSNCSGGPRGIPPRMRTGMMLSAVNADQSPAFVDQISGQRILGSMLIGAPPEGPQGINSIVNAQMHHQQSQFQFSSQHLNSPGYPSHFQHPSNNCIQSEMPRHATISNSSPCISNHLHDHHQFESSIRNQFHGSLPSQPGINPQTVNNTYVNANIAIEHVNIQNVPGGYDPSPVVPYQGTGGLTFDGVGVGSNGVSYSRANTGQPSSFDHTTNHVHIRPSAPNTIQYYSNRPPPPPREMRQPVNLDFLPISYSGGHVPPRSCQQQQSGEFMPQSLSHGQCPPMMGFPNGTLTGLPSHGQPQQHLEPDHDAFPESFQNPAYHQFQQQLYASNAPSSRHSTGAQPLLTSQVSAAPQ